MTQSSTTPEPSTATDKARILLTGAAGSVGRSLRASFGGGEYRSGIELLRLTDLPPTASTQTDLGGAAGHEEIVYADLLDQQQTLRLMQGIDTVIHLAAIATEADYADIRASNMDTTLNVLEAARQAGVRRVVFASSVHAVGFYPRSHTVSTSDAYRPDTFYGLSKMFGEGLGRMYHDRFGLEFVAVRIYSFVQTPQNRRHLSTWLSPNDAAQLFYKAATAQGVGYLVVSGISDNSRRWVAPDGWDALEYTPKDNAQQYAKQVEAMHGPPEDPAEQYQGGEFVRPQFLGKAEPR